jgi:hypothetical protein
MRLFGELSKEDADVSMGKVRKDMYGIPMVAKPQIK